LLGQSPPAELARFSNVVDKLDTVLNEKAYPKAVVVGSPSMFP